MIGEEGGRVIVRAECPSEGKYRIANGACFTEVDAGAGRERVETISSQRKWKCRQCGNVMFVEFQAGDIFETS